MYSSPQINNKTNNKYKINKPNKFLINKIQIAMTKILPKPKFSNKVLIISNNKKKLPNRKFSNKVLTINLIIYQQLFLMILSKCKFSSNKVLIINLIIIIFIMINLIIDNNLQIPSSSNTKKKINKKYKPNSLFMKAQTNLPPTFNPKWIINNKTQILNITVRRRKKHIGNKKRIKKSN